MPSLLALLIATPIYTMESDDQPQTTHPTRAYINHIKGKSERDTMDLALGRSTPSGRMHYPAVCSPTCNASEIHSFSSLYRGIPLDEFNGKRSTLTDKIENVDQYLIFNAYYGSSGLVLAIGKQIARLIVEKNLAAKVANPDDYTERKWLSSDLSCERLCLYFNKKVSGCHLPLKVALDGDTVRVGLHKEIYHWSPFKIQTIKDTSNLTHITITFDNELSAEGKRDVHGSSIAAINSPIVSQNWSGNSLLISAHVQADKVMQTLTQRLNALQPKE